jgi:hypothetical protein
VPVRTQSGLEIKVLFRGKPVANAEVVALLTAPKKQEKAVTSADGTARVDVTMPALVGIRARHIEERAGEHEGAKYAEVRHYATLVMQAGTKAAAAEGADPGATRLLAEARAAPASWANFTGFAAEIEVNFDGKLSRGQVEVDAKGKVTVRGLEPEMAAWARRTLGSIVAHRTDGSAGYDTPCAYADGEEHHPLGRAVRVLNDELHSSYRIRDRQITVVNRATPNSRFTITVLENRTNAEGKYLPASYAVHYWDPKTGALQKTEAHVQTWTRVGSFDLPALSRVITADRDVSAKSLTLSNHRLLQTAAK